MAWQRALASSELALGSHQRVELGGQGLLLARLETGLKAVHDTCLHRGASLAPGRLEAGAIRCYLHDWAFSLEDGSCLQVPGLSLKTFNTKEEEGSIYVEI